MGGIVNSTGARSGIIGQTEGGIDHSTFFRAYMTSAPTMTHVTWTLMSIDTETFDIGDNFTNSTTFKYTVPSSGYYHFSGAVMMWSADPVNFMVKLYVNGSAGEARGEALRQEIRTANNSTSFPFSYIAYYTVGDYVQLYAYIEESGSIASSIYTGAEETFMTGYKISN